MLPQISIESASGTEGTDLNFLLTLSAPSLTDVTVDYRIVRDGSALIDGTDFFSSNQGDPGVITFFAGQTTATLSVGADNNSSEDEFDENFTVELSNPDGATLAGGEPVLTATGVFFDNDGSTQDRALFVSDPVILEGDNGTKQAVFEVRLSEAFTSDLTFNYTTVDGTARAGEDYTATSGSLTFDAGRTVATVAVDIIGDDISEVAESFSLVVETDAPVFNNVEDSAGIATLLDDDTITDLPVISILPAESREGTNMFFAVHLSEPSLSDVLVDYRLVRDGSALLDGSDFFSGDAGAGGTISIPAGDTSVFLPIGADNNSGDDEFDENFTIELSDPRGAVLAGGGDTLTANGTFLDDDGTAQDRALFVSDPVILEGDSGTTQAVFELRLSEAASTDITLNYTTADGTATAGSDYVATSGSVTFIAGQTVASVSVDVTGDTDAETPETFSLVVDPTTLIFSGVQDSTGIATLIDDDTGEGLPEISILPTESLEGTNMRFAVRLSEASLTDVTVSYRLIKDGSALLDGSDFFSGDAGAPGSLTIPAGETSVFLAVGSDNNSSDDEFDENFSVELSDPVGATLAGGELTLTANGTFLDNDGSAQDRALFVSDPVILEGDSGTKQAVFEVRLSTPADSDITLDYTTADGTATAGSDYRATTGSVTFLAGQTVASVAIDVFSDTTAEMPETFSLVVEPSPLIFSSYEDSAGIATLLDDDTDSVLPEISVTSAQSTEGTNMRFTVYLSEPSLSDVTVDYRLVADGSALLDGSDFFSGTPGEPSSLVIPAGETVVTLAVGSDNNSSEDEFDENFTLELSNPSGATLAGGETVLTANGTFLDNDGSAQDRALFVSDPTIAEGDTGTKLAVFEIRLSEPYSDDITLDYSTVDGTATSGSDYVAKAGSVTFLAGQTVASVAVEVNGDFDVETTETFSLQVETTAPIFGADDNVGNARIVNNDLPNVDPNANNDSYAVDENGTLTVDDDGDGVLANDTDEGSVERAALVEDVENGTLSLNADGTFTYTPDADFNGTDSFVYRAFDNRGGTDTARASIVVNSTNRQPTDLALDNASIAENAGAGAIVGNLSAADADGDALLFSLSDDAGGRFRVDGNVLQAVASLDFEAATSYTVEVVARDPDGAESTESFTIGVLNDESDDNVNLRGDANDNRLVGTEGNDTLVGLGGNDTLVGLGGDDTLRGDNGTDNLVGGDGNDLLIGGESVNDRRDNLFGGAGDDTIFGGYGNDEVRGDAGNDVVSGGFGADTVIGGTGNDSITGSALGDLLFGSDGDDFINGGFGFDRVNGGTGADEFFHLGIADHGTDFIQDYNSAEGDVLVFGGAGATASQFQVNNAFREESGVPGVAESFVIYRPTEQILWALIDGAGQDEINLQIGGEIFNLNG